MAEEKKKKEIIDKPWITGQKFHSFLLWTASSVPQEAAYISSYMVKM